MLGGSASALEEELTSTREHLYTVVEELETSNEKAQSLNEEIQTANVELQAKSLEWQALNTELEGICATVDFPLLAFDERAMLRRTNRAVQRQLGIDDGWLGRHASALRWPSGMPPAHGPPGLPPGPKLRLLVALALTAAALLEALRAAITRAAEALQQRWR